MAGYELIGKEERDAANEVFDRGGVLFRHGFEKMRNGVYKVDEFENVFAQKFNIRYARAVSSGTAALLVALKALGIKPGDEVITQSFTFVATVEAIIEAGAVPIITEINKTLNMNPEDLEKKITGRTKLIIPVHMMGVPCQMQEILEIAEKHNIPVLEDTAQAIGGSYKGKELGTIGEAGIFSFDFGKNLTTGEGGMVVTNNKELYLRAKEYSDHGHEGNSAFPRGEDTRKISGFNFNMTELQGAIGLAQIKKLDWATEQQRKNKKKIKEAIKDLPGIEFRGLPDEEGDCGDTLVFFLPDKEKAKKFANLFAENGFSTKNIPSAFNWHFAGTWSHMLPQFEIYKEKDLMKLWEKSLNLVQRAIAVPILVKMDEEQINSTVKAIKESYESSIGQFRNYKNVPYYILGPGSISQLEGLLKAKRIGEKSTAVFLVDDFFYDKEIYKKLPLEKEDILIFVSTKEEPKAEYIDQLIDEIKEKCQNQPPAAIIGMGGGTVMDISKCVSILLTNPGKAEDYQGWDLVKNPAIYKIGIPTISGTGAESSRTAVLTSKKVKLGMNSDYSVFDQLILDPDFLKTVPPDKFIYTAMDCYLHDIELLKGNNSKITKALAEESLEIMREIFLKEMNYEKLMVASYLGGLAMVTADGGHICHPVSYGLSLVLGTRHGLAVCLSFNSLADYYPEEIKEFREILAKFKVELPKNITKETTEEQFEKMAEAVLKNERPLRSAFGENWQEIFTKEKVKEILRRI